MTFEKGLRTCALATAFAGELRLDDADRAAVFHVALLRSIGCTAHASENAALFGDDTAFEGALNRLDPGDAGVFTRQLADFGGWAPGRQAELARRFVAIAPVEGPRASRAGCEVSRALGVRLALSPAAIDALDDVYERWDGRGSRARGAVSRCRCSRASCTSCTSPSKPCSPPPTGAARRGGRGRRRG